MVEIPVWIASYLLGAVPFGYLIAKAKGVNIFSVGSGNVGATNVMRACGKPAGFAVFILDFIKGLAPALAGHYFLGGKIEAFTCGALAILGHSFSPFLKFRGGKGISTGLGAIMGTSPFVALTAFGAFLVVLGFTRFVSLGSLVAAIAMVVSGFFYGDPREILFAYVLLALFIFVRHRENIGRLVQGTERKFGEKVKSEEASDRPHP